MTEKTKFVMLFMLLLLSVALLYYLNSTAQNILLG